MHASAGQIRGVGLVALANVFYGVSIVLGVGGITGIWNWILFTALAQGLVVLAFLYLRGGRPALRPHMPARGVVWLGFLIALQVGLYLAALELTDDGAMVVALHLCAPIIYMAADLAMRRRRAQMRDGVIAGLVVIGLALATGASLNLDSLIAMTLSLLSAGVIALMWLYMARVPYGANRTAVMGWAVLALAAMFCWAPLIDGTSGMGVAGWGWAALVGALVVAPAGAFEWFGVAGAGPMLTSLAALIQLPATALLLWVVRGDPLGPAQVIAALAIGAAVALELLRPPPQDPTASLTPLDDGVTLARIASRS